MTPFLPHYARPPCKVIEYYEIPFDDKAGHTGIKTMVKYKDKKGKIIDECAHIKWDKI